ncbi:MAG: hypothetical protein AAFY56_24015 [Pseudomonadota bacterium]
MDLIDKLPSMETDSLAVLLENVERLEQSGTKDQKSAAADLRPALEAELANRQAAKQAASLAKRAESTAKRAATKRATKSKKAAQSEGTSEE